MKPAATVLLVMRNRNNHDLISQCLVEYGYQTRPAVSLAAAKDQIEAHEPPEAAIVDLTGFSREVWSVCQQLRGCLIPFMVLSPSSSPLIRQEGQSQGASDVHVKPIAMLELVAVVDRLLGR